MAWSFVGVGAPVVSTGTSITLTEPAGCAAGDLLVACISYRIASATPLTAPDEWEFINQRNANNILTTTSAVASGYMAFTIRGNAQPRSVFTFPVAASQAIGRIVAYRDVNMLAPHDTNSSFTTAINTTAVSGGGLTTAEANELIVVAACGGQEATFTNFDAATNPTTTSGTGSGSTAAPTVGTWLERADSSSTIGADGSLAIADAIRGTAGATGVFTCTASLGASHAHIAAAFKMGPTPGIATPGVSPITMAGNDDMFAETFLAQPGNSGELLITVPDDAQIAVVAVLGRSDDTGFFDTNMTLTKGSTDTPMTRVGPTGQTSAQTPVIYYLALPDTGTNKSLKWDWTGTNPPAGGTEPTIAVTFWKGIDTASPVRSSGFQGEVASRFHAVTGTMTAQNGDLVVAMVGGYWTGTAEGSIDVWYNLNELYQWDASPSHDGAWGTFAPSGNLAVGGLAATELNYGVCAAIVLKPAAAATPGSSAIVQTGSTLDFGSSSANSGTVSSTITVPSDAQIVCVGVKGWAAETPYFTNMTFTKGGSDTAMTRVMTPDDFNSHRAAIFYLVLPDTGTNKSLKYDWAGTNAPGETPLISVTFWKGIDTASPVRSSGTSEAALYDRGVLCATGILTAQNGDLVLCFAGADDPGADGTADTWLNLGTVSQCTKSADRHDGAWGSFAPSGDLSVGLVTATNWQYGVCAAIVLKPAPSKLVSYARNGTNTVASPLTVTFPATLAGDCLIYVGIGNGTAAMTVQANTGAAGVHGTLGGVQTPRASSAGVNFSYIVGLIAAPAAGTTSVSLSCSNATLEKELAVWVVRGLTNPTQDKGVYSIGQGPGTLLVSGLTGTLAAAEEFAVAYGVAMEESTTGINTAQTGSSGFVADQVTTPIFGSSFSHQDTTSTTQIQSAFNQSGGMGDALCATYYSGPSGVTGTFSPTDSPDTAVGWTGTVAWLGTLDTTDTADTAAFTGTVAWTGTLDVRDDADTAAFTGEVAWLAVLLATDPADVAAFTGDVIPIVEGTLLVTDAPDIADFTGDVVPYTAGILDATDDPDTASFAGTVEWWAVLDATDSPDIAAFTGVILIPLDGILDATDPADIAAFTGETITYIALAALETADTAVFNGLVLDGIGGVLDATEDADTASFASDIINNMVLDATDDPDIAAFTGKVDVAGTLTTTDAADTAAFTGLVTIPVPFVQTTVIG